MRIHACILDRRCRQYGAVGRVHVSWGDWQLVTSFLPGSKTQGFDWRQRRPSKKWRWVTLRPPRRYYRISE